MTIKNVIQRGTGELMAGETAMMGADPNAPLAGFTSVLCRPPRRCFASRKVIDSPAGPDGQRPMEAW